MSFQLLSKLHVKILGRVKWYNCKVKQQKGETERQRKDGKFVFSGEIWEEEEEESHLSGET